jgi:hypothetical protein
MPTEGESARKVYRPAERPVDWHCARQHDVKAIDSGITRLLTNQPAPLCKSFHFIGKFI